MPRAFGTVFRLSPPREATTQASGGGAPTYREPTPMLATTPSRSPYHSAIPTQCVRYLSRHRSTRLSPQTIRRANTSPRHRSYTSGRISDPQHPAINRTIRIQAHCQYGGLYSPLGAPGACVLLSEPMCLALDLGPGPGGRARVFLPSFLPLTERPGLTFCTDHEMSPRKFRDRARALRTSVSACMWSGSRAGARRDIPTRALPHY